MERPGELVEVEVDDDLPPEPGARAAGDRRHGPSTRLTTGAPGVRRGPVRSLAVLVVAALVGLGVVVATGAEQRAVARDDEAVRRASAVHGTVASLRLPLTTAWTPDGRVVGAVAGVVLVEEGEPVELVAREHTGAVRWRIPLPGGRSGGLRCPEDLEGGTLVVCERPAVAVTAPNTPAALVQQEGRLVVLRAVDGAATQAWPLPRRYLGWGVLEDRSVAVVSRDAGEVVVRRLRPGAREPEWTTSVVLPGETSTRAVSTSVRDDAVVVSGAFGLLVRADGSPSGPWLPEAGTAAVDLVAVPDGAVVWRASRLGRVERTDGGAGAEVPGQPARPAVDDGSEPGVLLVLDGTPDVVRAVETSTGRVLWETPARATDLLVRLDGRLVVAGRGGVRAVDLVTGDQLWRAEAGSPDSPLLGAVTDGLRLLLPGYRPTTGRTVVAVRLTDGSVSWETGLPAGSWRFVARGEVVMTGSGGRSAVLASRDAAAG